ncbi:MAG TPA: hypothetical protein VGO47_01910, partial [Chlamydiales bacterium]|nr:hypothetical protein [Chlamydiales bacterium]
MSKADVRGSTSNGWNGLLRISLRLSFFIDGGGCTSDEPDEVGEDMLLRWSQLVQTKHHWT